MFSSDKDLRKPVAKNVVPVRPQRPTGNASKPSIPDVESTNTSKGQSVLVTQSTGTHGNNTDILEVARIEREQRALLRERTVHVLRIQKWYRGRCAAQKHFSVLYDGITTKLSDVEKISAILASKGAEFTTPPQLGLPIILDYLYLARYAPKRSFQLVGRLCTLVVNPSATVVDSSKHLLVFIRQQDSSMHVAYRLVTHLFQSLTSTGVQAKGSKVSKPSNSDLHSANLNGVLAHTLQLLLGTSISYKLKYNADIESAFSVLRRRVWENGRFLTQLREYLMHKTEPLQLITAHSDGSSSVATVSSAVRGSHSTVESDRMFALTLFMIESMSTDLALLRSNLVNFITNIFTVPMLTLLLSPAMVEAFAQWVHFRQVLILLQDPAVWTLPEQPTAGSAALKVIRTGQWLLGNLAAVSLYLPTGGTAESSAAPTATSPRTAAAGSGDAVLLGVSKVESSSSDSATLQLYLDACARWLSLYGIPEVLQGRSGILWQRQGSNSTAVAVPAGLEGQILTLLHGTVLTRWSQHILQPLYVPDGSRSGGTSGAVSAGKGKGALDPALIPADPVQAEWVERYGNPADLSDIRDALASSAYTVTQRTLTERREEATWFTAKWAKKIATNLTGGLALPSFSLFSSSGGGSGSGGGGKGSGGGAKAGGGSAEGNLTVNPVGPSRSVDPSLVLSLCNLWAMLLSGAATSPPDSLPWKALSQLAFSGTVLPKLWCFLMDRVDLDKLATSGAGGKGAQVGSEYLSVLYCCICVMKLVLVVLDDSELYESAKPLPLHQVVRLVRSLKVMLFKALREDPDLFVENLRDQNSSGGSSSGGSGGGWGNPVSYGGLKEGGVIPGGPLSGDKHRTAESQRRVLCHSMRAAGAVLTDLYTRWARRPFSAATLWEVTETSSSAIKAEFAERSAFALVLLRTMPWAVDFHERMRLFRNTLDAERLQIQGSNDLMSGGPQRSRGIIVRVRKTRVLEDGMEALSKVGAAIKDRVIVKYVNEFGEDEAGIDAGGLFKDFVTDLSSRIFDPSYGLFCTTAAGLLYPNPSAPVLFDVHEMDALYVFLGRVLGKALFENITLQPQFAHFFLAFMHGRYNYMGLINDLHTLDPELYKNLMFLKTYEGDIADLGLTFAVTDTALGGQREVELIPGGAGMDVTSQNRHRYINLVAKYYLHDRLKRQAKAFFSGLHQVIAPELLSVFCAPELQILISGSQTGLSVDDLRQHTRYAGGYMALDSHMRRFWTVFAELSPADQALLLKFVTSCERPPSLGFASLQPPFTIQRVECSDDLRLPTASTCFNILKLPTYSSSKVLKEKLLQSIHAKAGFDLS